VSRVSSLRPIKANYSERVGRKVTDLMSSEDKGSGATEDTGEGQASPSFWMGFFLLTGAGQMELVVCPKCGEPIECVEWFKWMVASCAEKEISGRCSCGEKYIVRLSFMTSLPLSFFSRNRVLSL
jgi:hypothetical protein